MNICVVQSVTVGPLAKVRRRECCSILPTLSRRSYYKWSFQLISGHFRLTTVRLSINCTEPHRVERLGSLTEVRWQRCVRREYFGFCQRWAENRTIHGHLNSYLANYGCPLWGSASIAQNPHFVGWLGVWPYDRTGVSVGNTFVFCRSWAENRTIRGHFKSYLANSGWPLWGPASISQNPIW
jgi:hypothetical protein